MTDKKSWLAVAVGAGLILNGCAGMSKNQAALIGAVGCGIPAGVAGGLVAHNNDPNVHMPVGAGAVAGVVTGALLCGGLAYLLTPEPKPPPSAPPPPPPPPPPKPKPAPPPPPPPPPPAPKVERTIILDDVLFDFDKSTIKPEA